MENSLYDFDVHFINKFHLSDNISLKECVYGTNNDAPEELSEMIRQHLTNAHLYNLIAVAQEAQIVRDYFGDKVIIHWGGAFRPLPWEIAAGRSGKSQHVLARALDYHLEKTPLEEVYAFINRTFKKGGRGMSKSGNFVHKDIRPYYAEWNY
jgi:hypothetical protein